MGTMIDYRRFPRTVRGTAFDGRIDEPGEARNRRWDRKIFWICLVGLVLGVGFDIVMMHVKNGLLENEVMKLRRELQQAREGAAMRDADRHLRMYLEIRRPRAITF